MGDDRKGFETRLAEAFAKDSPTGGHVPLPDLMAYDEGALSTDRREAVQVHLAQCRECADSLLEWKRFNASDGSQDASARSEEEQAWLALEARIASDRQQVAPPTARPPRPASRHRPWALGLAASLILAISLGLWSWSLLVELESLREPQINVPLINLRATGFSRGETGEGTLRGEADRFVVILNPQNFPAIVEHQIEVIADDGAVVWSGSGLRPTQAGTFDLELNRRLLAPGHYRLRLLRRDEEVAEFALRILP